MKNGIRLRELQDGAKLEIPILWNRNAAGILGMEDLELSIRKLYTIEQQCSVELRGRFAGLVEQPLLLVVQVYNEDHEMIGTDFNLSIGEADGEEDALEDGKPEDALRDDEQDDAGWEPEQQDYPFERILELPAYESVSQIAVSVIPDPAVEGLRDALNELPGVEEDSGAIPGGKPQKSAGKGFAEDWEERWAEWLWLEDHGRM